MPVVRLVIRRPVGAQVERPAYRRAWPSITRSLGATREALGVRGSLAPRASTTIGRNARASLHRAPGAEAFLRRAKRGTRRRMPDETTLIFSIGRLRRTSATSAGSLSHRHETHDRCSSSPPPLQSHTTCAARWSTSVRVVGTHPRHGGLREATGAYSRDVPPLACVKRRGNRLRHGRTGAGTGWPGQIVRWPGGQVFVSPNAPHRCHTRCVAPGAVVGRRIRRPGRPRFDPSSRCRWGLRRAAP
jgi:hypothetical protein